jgi:hypothetical protein
MPKVAATTLSLAELNRATLARQLLLERARLDVLAALEATAGLQAQLARPPFVGLWTRLRDFERADLDRALRARTAVRGTLMRATLHLVSARDYRAWRTPIQPVLTRGLAVLGERGTGIDRDAVLGAARRLLASGPRTFEDIRDHLVARFPQCNDRGLGHTVRMLEPLVQEPIAGTEWGFPSIARFALASDWIRKPLATDDDVAPLLLRYLAAFGPATVADAQAWSGLQALRPVFESLRPRLAVFRDEQKRELFDLPDAPRPDADVAAPVRFLPEFDNLLLAHQDRRRVVADAHKKAVYLPGLRVAATFLVDGTVAGTWSIDTKKGAATLTVCPFGKPAPATKRALAEEGERLAAFLAPDAKTRFVTFAE